MARKIRQLIKDLRRAGFTDRGGKGSYRNFLHPCGARLTLGPRGRRRKPYQEREAAAQIATSEKSKTGDKP